MQYKLPKWKNWSHVLTRPQIKQGWSPRFSGGRPIHCRIKMCTALLPHSYLFPCRLGCTELYSVQESTSVQPGTRGVRGVWRRRCTCRDQHQMHAVMTSTASMGRSAPSAASPQVKIPLNGKNRESLVLRMAPHPAIKLKLWTRRTAWEYSIISPSCTEQKVHVGQVQHISLHSYASQPWQ